MSLRIGVNRSLTLGGTSPWQITDNLLLNYTGRTGSQITESYNGLHAKLLSPCYKGSATSYYSCATFNIGKVHTIEFYTDLSLLTVTQGFMYYSSTNYIYIDPVNKRIRYNINGANNYAVWTTTPTGVHKFHIIRNGTALSFTCDGAVIASATILDANNLDFNVTTIFRASSVYSPEIITPYIRIMNTDTGNDCFLMLNNPSKPQDLTATNRAFNVFNVTAANESFMEWAGGIHDLGYSQYSDGTNLSYIPMFNGAAVTPNSAFYTGFTKVKDVAGDSDSVFAELPGYIDFDPDNSGDSKLDNLNLANTTRYSNDARALSWYSAAESYKWRLDYICDPRLYMPLLNVGYRGMNHAVITVSTLVIGKLNGFLVYSVDKTLRDEWDTMKYAGYSSLAEYPNGNYTVDENNYVEFHSVAYSDDFGTSAAKTAYENTAILQALFDAGVYSDIVIGTTATDVYLISQPLRPSNVNIKFNCICKMMNSVTDTLAADIVKGATSFTATDASKFHVGEQLCVTDDNQLQVYSTYRAWGGAVTNIAGNVITLDTAAPYNYTASANGRIATVQSNVLIDNTNFVTVDMATGVYIDNNRDGQAAYHPTYLYNSAVVESYKQACGIAVWQSSYITLTDKVVVRDASMHGISFSSELTSVLNTYCTLGDVHVYNSHEKCFHFKYCKYFTCGDLYADGSTWEDGIICYALCSYFTFGAVTALNCARHGFAWNNSSTNCSLASLTTADCTDDGLFIMSPVFSCPSVDLGNCRFIINDSGTKQPTGIILGNITIDACLRDADQPVVWFYGGVGTVDIDSLTLTGCSGIGIKASAIGAELPVDVEVKAGGIYSHTGTLTSIAPGAGVILTGDFS